MVTTIANFSYGTFYPRLLYQNNKLFLIFSSSNISGQPEVYIMKMDITPSSLDNDVIEDNQEISEISLYPNPAKQLITIEFLSKERMHLFVDVFNQRGQWVAAVYSGFF